MVSASAGGSTVNDSFCREQSLAFHARLAANSLERHRLGGASASG
jgi:hypothetical protein